MLAPCEVMMGFIFGVERTVKFPLMISIRRHTRFVLDILYRIDAIIRLSFILIIAFLKGNATFRLESFGRIRPF